MSYGWFPRLNSRGEVVSGGLGQVWAAGQLRGAGFGPQWLTDSQIVYGIEHAPDGQTVLRDLGSGAAPVIADLSYNVYVAHEGRWAGARPGIIHLYDGVTRVREVAGGSPVLYRHRFGFLIDDNQRLLVDEREIVRGPVMHWTMDAQRVGWVLATGVYSRAAYVEHQRVSFDETEGAIWLFGDGWCMTYANPAGYKIRPIGASEGYLIEGDAYNPDVALINGRIVFVASTASGEPLRYEIDPASPRRDLRVAGPAPEPKPEPKPEPGPQPEQPMKLPDHVFATLQRLRPKYPTPLGQHGAALLNEVAWLHRDEGWGLEAKPNGNNCAQPTTGTRCGCDILRTLDKGWDVLSDTEGAGEPVQADSGPADPARFVAPVNPGVPDPEPKPEPKPEPTPDLERRLAAMEQTILALRADTAQANAALAAEMAALKVRMVNEEQKPAPAVDLSQYEVQISVGRTWSHSHPATGEIVKK